MHVCPPSGVKPKCLSSDVTFRFVSLSYAFCKKYGSYVRGFYACSDATFGFALLWRGLHGVRIVCSKCLIFS